MTQINFPDLCAWCGENKSDAFMLLSYASRKLTGYYVVVKTYQNTNASFHMPICKECAQKYENFLNRSKAPLWIGRVLGFLPLIIIGIMEVDNILESDFLGVGIVISVLLSLVLGVIFDEAAKLITGNEFNFKTWGDYVDGKFYFTKKSFRTKFYEMNPQLDQK